MVGFNSRITIDEIIHLLEAFAKCVYSTIFSVIYSAICSATKPWSQRFGEKLSQIQDYFLYLAELSKQFIQCNLNVYMPVMLGRGEAEGGHKYKQYGMRALMG